MRILCDTCSIFMLIRIAPDMLIQEEYACYTIPPIRKEIIQTQKFKEKYPWRVEVRDKIRCLPNSYFTNDDSYKLFYSATEKLIDTNTINEKTGRLFDLSVEDRSLIACALAGGYWLTTGDADVIEFPKQEFPKSFKGNISPLGLINKWLRKGIIQWNNERHAYVADWFIENEKQQPKNQKRVFKKLTGRGYPGS